MLTHMASAGSIGETASLGGALAAGCYFSELSREADLVDLIELFVEELPERVVRMKQAAGEENWQEVGRLAHQLKGAGGSYGFPQLTAAAWQVERAAREVGSARAVAEALLGLEVVCERVRAGAPV
jgi:HPt (histidine-containing phosphotransfer) domain-containing protein